MYSKPPKLWKLGSPHSGGSGSGVLPSFGQRAGKKTSLGEFIEGHSAAFKASRGDLIWVIMLKEGEQIRHWQGGNRFVYDVKAGLSVWTVLHDQEGTPPHTAWWAHWAPQAPPTWGRSCHPAGWTSETPEQCHQELQRERKTTFCWNKHSAWHLKLMDSCASFTRG